jgi:hypothetical protein
VLLVVGALCAVRRHPARKKWLAFALYVTIALAAAPYAHFPDMTVLLLPILLTIDYIAEAGMRSFSTRLMVLCCAALFLVPYVLLILGGHYWWNSRIYLLFPLLLVFVGCLALELCVAEAGNC